MDGATNPTEQREVPAVEFCRLTQNVGGNSLGVVFRQNRFARTFLRQRPRVLELRAAEEIAGLHPGRAKRAINRHRDRQQLGNPRLLTHDPAQALYGVQTLLVIHLKNHL